MKRKCHKKKVVSTFNPDKYCFNKVKQLKSVRTIMKEHNKKVKEVVARIQASNAIMN